MKVVASFVVFMFALTSGPVADARPTGRAQATAKVDWSQYLETKSDKPPPKTSKQVAKAKTKTKTKTTAKKRSAARTKKRR